MPLIGSIVPELYQFNLKRLIIALLIAAALVGSWSLCGSQCCSFKRDHSLQISVWNRVDLLAFRFFNRWLLTGDNHTFIARLFVALNSVVIGELITNLCLILVTYLVFSSKHVLHKHPRSFKIAILLAMIVYGMPGQMLLTKLSRDSLCPNRPSPSVIFRFSTVSLENQAVSSSSNLFNMDRLFQEAKDRDLVKEVAYDSWPGEHTAVTLIWSLFMSVIISRSPASLSRTKRFLMYTLVWFLAILFSVARLVSGAHWLSDCVAGGLSEAIVIVAIGVYTPVFQLCTQAIHWPIGKTKSAEKKLP